MVKDDTMTKAKIWQKTSIVAGRREGATKLKT
jgi:hypothetical protein